MNRFSLFKLISLLLLYSSGSFAGGNVRIKGHKFIIVPFAGAIWQHSYFGELELGHVFDIHYVEGHFGHTILVYSKLGAEFNFLDNTVPHPEVINLNHELWAPKFSSEIDLGYFCIRGSFIDYTEPGINKCYFTPEAGVTLSGFITLAAGYNLPISNSGFAEIKPLRVSLNIMIPMDITGSSKQK